MSLYDELLTVWKMERSNDRLARLEENFYDKTRAYLNHLETQSSQEPNEILQDLFEKRWERCNYILNDLISMRRDKHIQNSLHNENPPDELPVEEQKFREQMDNVFNTFRDEVLGIEQPQTQEEIFDEDQQSYQLVKFIEKENLSSVGSDLRSYGPFDEGDIAFLPTENVKNYLKRSQVERIDIR